MSQENVVQKNIKTLERGDVYFVFRPKVETNHPHGEADVQRLHIVLHPHGENKFRLLTIGQKKLPEPDEQGRPYWGFVESVVASADELKPFFAAESYRTQTRGIRHQPSARPVAEGNYQLIRHGDHTHFIYSLEVPEEIGEVQEDFNIESEASYIMSVKNPQKESLYPNRLKTLFHNRKFIDVDPVELLDYEDSEFILIYSAEDVRSELGLELDVQDERDSSADIFADLHLDRSQQPVAPLFEGRWQ